MKPTQIIATMLLLFSGCVTFEEALEKDLAKYDAERREFIEAYGCNADQVLSRFVNLRSFHYGAYMVPRVGWTACKLLEVNGMPWKVDISQSTRGTSVTWWYRLDYDPLWGTYKALVMTVLEKKGGVWTVSYVGGGS